MLRAIQEVRNYSEARACLNSWIHRDRHQELVDELIVQLRKGGEEARELLLEL